MIGNQHYLFISGMTTSHVLSAILLTVPSIGEVLSDLLTYNTEHLPCLGLGPIPNEEAEYGRRQTRG